MATVPYLITPEFNNNVRGIIHRAKLFSKEECEAIIEYHKELPMRDGVTNGYAGKELRKSDVWWIHNEGQQRWVYDRLALPVKEMNKLLWKFDLTGMTEAVQLARYTEGSHFDWHTDVGLHATSLRKLSLVVMLSNTKDFEGGKFEVTGQIESGELRQGDAIVFPSFVVHRVTPVTSGERWTLASWVTGPAFK